MHGDAVALNSVGLPSPAADMQRRLENIPSEEANKAVTGLYPQLLPIHTQLADSAYKPVLSHLIILVGMMLKPSSKKAQLDE